MKKGFGVGSVIVIIAIILIVIGYIYYGNQPTDVDTDLNATTTADAITPATDNVAAPAVIDATTTMETPVSTTTTN